MKLQIILPMISALILSGCVVAPRPGGGLEIVPILPVIIELSSDEPYYQHQGYHYFYSNDRWYYSTERRGPWTELPRSHWPKETRHRGPHHRR